jgi:lipid-binding SYLF domain-containing protein
METFMRGQSWRIGLLLVTGVLLAACENQPAPKTADDAKMLDEQVSSTVQRFKSTDSSMDKFFTGAYGYVVFPAIRAAAIGVGGAYGQGEVFEQGKMIGYADMSQANVGASLGGQRYSEVIFFQDQGALATFKSNQVQFDAQASAIAASTGAGTSANYTKGVVVFTQPEGGLMFQAAVGGQKFRFTPMTMK